MLAKMASLWSSTGSARYTRMDTQEHENDPDAARVSFEQPLERLQADKFTRWPNFSIEDGYKDDHDRHPVQSLGVAPTVEVFFPPRMASGRNSIHSNPFIPLRRMCTRFPVRDMSWMVGFSFTIGSAVFVVNGFFLLLPLIDPTTDFSAETPYLTPASSVLGTVIFLGGGWAAILEALNLKRGVIETEGQEVEMIKTTELTPITRREVLHHRHTQSGQSSSLSNIPERPESPPSDSSSETHVTPPVSLALLGSSTFIWWPTAQQFTQSYRHDLYFFAGIIQFVGAVIFAIATVTSIPGIIDFNNTILVDLANLLPATLGGILFLTAAIFQVLNAQRRWYLPSPGRLDWHIGIWNVIGSLGFTLAGALPLVGTAEADFQATCAAFWGSWAFLVGSGLQWYSAMGNYVW